MIYKKLSIFIILCILLISTVCISGCVSTSQSSTTEIPTLVEDRNIYTHDGICVYLNPQTGVNYLVYSVQVSNGAMGGICPRYNANGTLYVSEVKK